MKLSDLERDRHGYVVLPCGSLLLEVDSYVLEEHVPYCSTCASQIDHPGPTERMHAEGAAVIADIIDACSNPTPPTPSRHERRHPQKETPMPEAPVTIEFLVLSQLAETATVTPDTEHGNHVVLTEGMVDVGGVIALVLEHAAHVVETHRHLGEFAATPAELATELRRQATEARQ